MKEEEEEKEMQAELATKEQVLVSEIEQFLRSYDRPRQITDVEHRAVAWFVAKSAVKLREKRKRTKKRRKRTRRARFRSCSS